MQIIFLFLITIFSIIGLEGCDELLKSSISGEIVEIRDMNPDEKEFWDEMALCMKTKSEARKNIDDLSGALDVPYIRTFTIRTTIQCGDINADGCFSSRGYEIAIKERWVGTSTYKALVTHETKHAILYMLTGDSDGNYGEPGGHDSPWFTDNTLCPDFPPNTRDVQKDYVCPGEN